MIYRFENGLCFYFIQNWYLNKVVENVNSLGYYFFKSFYKIDLQEIEIFFLRVIQQFFLLLNMRVSIDNDDQVIIFLVEYKILVVGIFFLIFF